ncbi:MAG: nucleotidyltransferase domain-containing protein [Bacillota bacterium]|nr:nucleotidyltransferase domain-containing protein [Bacillota bacterium]
MRKKESFEKICAKYNIALAYLFGSQAKTGRALLEGQEAAVEDPLTDIDLGIVCREGLPGTKELLDLFSELYNELSDLFLPFRLDLVFLQENHSVFQCNAITGLCVFSFDEHFRSEYEEDILRKAADFRPFLEKYLDEYLEEAIKND